MAEGEKRGDPKKYEGQAVRIDKETVGYVLDAITLSELDTMNGELYLETETGNVYMIYKASDGRTAIMDSRSNQGKGAEMKGSYLTEKDVAESVLSKNKPFVYTNGKTTNIVGITFIPKAEKSIEGNRVVEVSDIRKRFRDAIDPIVGKKLDYEAIGRGFTLDEKNLPEPEHIFRPMGGNFFEEGDEPTLAGRVIARVYGQLVNRDIPPPKESGKDLLEECRAELRIFFDYVNKILTERDREGKKDLGLSNQRVSGTDHFFRSYGATDEHSMYFSKSHAHWKDRNAEEIRAYITVAPEQIKDLSKNFVDLSILLYDAGIDFTAKCASPSGAKNRTDNVVIYIARADQPKATPIIKEFLNERKLGQGHIKAGVVSAQDGLSWAPEPSNKDHKLYAEIAGSSGRTSFNAYVTARAIPTYLERLATAHTKKGNKKAAGTFAQEAKRVRGIIVKAT